jgi:hypothetical protein
MRKYGDRQWCSFARTDPARHGKPEWRFERVCGTPTVAYHQRHVLIEWSSVERLPAKSVDEHIAFLPPPLAGPPHRRAIRVS